MNHNYKFHQWRHQEQTTILSCRNLEKKPIGYLSRWKKFGCWLFGIEPKVKYQFTATIEINKHDYLCCGNFIVTECGTTWMVVFSSGTTVDIRSFTPTDFVSITNKCFVIFAACPQR